GRAIDIVLKRPLETVLYFVILALLVLPIESFVISTMAGGSGFVGAMYASHHVSAMYYGAGIGATPLRFLAGTSGGFSASTGIVFAAVFAVFVLIQMLGTILVHDALAADLPANSAEFMRNRANRIKDKINETRPKAAPGSTDTPEA